MRKDLIINNRIWIEGKEGTFLGNGRIQLLEKISELGSINEAAKELKMSYRKAWGLLDSMNKQAKEPLIIKSAGGSGGGGTKITTEGLKVISDFKILNKRCYEFLEKEVATLQF